MIALLRGHKTYIIGFLMVCLGVLQQDPQVVLNGLAIITGRAAIAKVGF